MLGPKGEKNIPALCKADTFYIQLTHRGRYLHKLRTRELSNRHVIFHAVPTARANTTHSTELCETRKRMELCETRHDRLPHEMLRYHTKTSISKLQALRETSGQLNHPPQTHLSATRYAHHEAKIVGAHRASTVLL